MNIFDIINEESMLPNPNADQLDVNTDDSNISSENHEEDEHELFGEAEEVLAELVAMADERISRGDVPEEMKSQYEEIRNDAEALRRALENHLSAYGGSPDVDQSKQRLLSLGRPQPNDEQGMY